MRIHAPSLRTGAALAALLSSALATKVNAGPWPEQISIGLGYGQCTSHDQRLTLLQARKPAILAQIQAVTAEHFGATFGLADGKYTHQNQQGTLSATSTEEANTYAQNLCISGRDVIHLDASAPRPTPMGHDGVRHIGVRVTSLYRVNGHACAIFSRDDQYVAAGCLAQSLSSAQGDRLIMAFRLGSSLYLTLGTQAVISVLPATGKPAYPIVALDY